MTAAPSSRSPYEARLQRAEKLSASLPFAMEILKFYRHVVSWQASVFSDLSVGVLSATDLSARGTPDLTQILPHYRGFLSAVEKHGPSSLAAAAAQISALPTDSWIRLLESYWQTGGLADQQVGAFSQFFARAALQPCAEAAAAALVPPQVLTRSTCPRCGARPLLGVLRAEGDGGKRSLLCSFCLQEWEFRRILCPTCGEEGEQKLPVYVAEQLPHLRVEACDTCKFYLRTVDLTKDGHAVPIVDDLAALPLTLWAAEHGYSRLQPNLLGT
jgi:FdhE protein